MRSGEELFDLVRSYADLGEHRTGTPADAATRDWLSAELERMGARVSRQAWQFPRYCAEWSLEVDGDAVDSLPLFYSQTGAFDSTAPIVRPLPLENGSVAAMLDDVVRQLPGGVPIVLATEGANGRLVAQNRNLEAPTAAPVLLAAGRDLERLKNGSVRARLRSWIEPGESENVVGSFGADVDDPYVITTPLTGWFRCAGERGTGIAVALAAAVALAERHPVLFVGTTGHELEHLGARAFRRASALRPRAALHLGASVAACDPLPDTQGLALSQRRWALLSAASHAPTIEQALAPAALNIVIDPPQPWPGEGREWRDTNAPLLSLVGAAAAFHAPDDLAETATTPAILERVAHAVIAAARILPESAS